MRVDGAVALITGGNRGLGLAFVKELQERGARRVYAGVRHPDRPVPQGVTPIKMDVTDSAAVDVAAAACSDVTLVVNNAGIGTLNTGTLDPDFIDACRGIFETNFYGMARVSQAFAPVIAGNGGGAFVNVLSDATWFARPMLAAYSASKSAAWSFTNALRLDLASQGIAVLAMHAGFIDTDMTSGVDVQKNDPRAVAATTLDALEIGLDEVLVDDQARLVKQTLSTDHGYYLKPPGIE